jgi:hypothetical protein
MRKKTGTLNLNALLELFDCTDEINKKCSNSINLLLGEELALSLLRDYVLRGGGKFNPLDGTPRQAGQTGSRGKRLDAWAEIKCKGKNYLYQIETKNWNANSKGGIAFPENANEEPAHRKERWGQYYDADAKTLTGEQTEKVLLPMNLPDGHEKDKIRPLLCFWNPLHPDGKPDAFFAVDIEYGHFDPPEKPFKPFKKLYVFSMSNHVRNLLDNDIKQIETDPEIMKNVLNRTDWLEKILPHN